MFVTHEQTQKWFYDSWQMAGVHIRVKVVVEVRLKLSRVKVGVESIPEVKTCLKVISL
jgi:hypothetical protein